MPSRSISPVLTTLLLLGCRVPCPDGVTDRQGTRCVDVPLEETTSASTSDASTSSSESSSSDDSSSSSDASSSTGTPPPCDDDPACGPGEDVFNCPAQCNTCGDAVIVPPELCDNGLNQDPPYSPTAPNPDACAPGCVLVEFCGDNILNGPEPCDSTEQTATCEADCRTPTCGDGTLNTLAGEACDDFNTLPGDGCSSDCRVERRVFATSAAYEGDLRFAIDNPDMLAGIPLADARCNALAIAAGLPPTFKAWLSDSLTSPSTRFDTSFSGLFRLLSPDFPVVADGWLDLTDGQLAHPIDADETGALVVLQPNVLTNTAPDGSSASNQHCSAWTLNDNSSTTIGQSSASDSTWTNLGESFCSNAYRLYCFEDP